MMQPSPPRTLVVIGHPRPGSFCEALAEAYIEGALGARAEVRRLDLARCSFDPDVRLPSPREQPLEPDLQAAREAILWAQHIVLVFPTWWGTMPARLKGFLDRVLAPGFAFEDREDDTGWDKLLTGRTGHLFTTMDTPPFVYRWIYGAPGLNAAGRATFDFCGIAPVRRTIFGPVKPACEGTRANWLTAAREHGGALRGGVLTRSERWWRITSPYLAALRLQFHPMAWLAYTLGALAAVRTGAGDLDWPVFIFGLLALFLLEIATVMSNEIFDLPSDRLNRHYGPFSGGSRVLVDGRIAFGDLKRACAAVFLAFLLLSAILLSLAPSPSVLALITVFAVLAMGYTVPPLKLCWRGLGELDVAFTHSVLLVVSGWVFQGGAPFDPLPWLIALPLFFSVFGAILLSGIPDEAADRAAGKRTLVVLMGIRPALRLAQVTTVLAIVAAVALDAVGLAGDAFAHVWIIALLHGALLVWLLERERRAEPRARRIDGLMATALSHIIWFVVPPLWQLLA